MLNRTLHLLFFLFLTTLHTYAQQQGTTGNEAKNLKDSLTLTECIRYALREQPAINQAEIDLRIARANNAIGISGWLPQVNGTANLQHYFQLPTAYSRINGQLLTINSGTYNVSSPSIGATQTLFSNDVLLAARAAHLNTQLAEQNIKATKIDLVSNVSKAFYDLLLSIEQVNVFKEDTARLKRNETDAYNRYVSGISDKVDYKQATISLNNSMAQLKTASEAIASKYAVLKQLMGYPTEARFKVSFDTAEMMQQIFVDTLAALQVEKRIEYQLLQTTRRIQHETTRYYQLGFLPNVSAFYNYYQQYQNNEFKNLYNKGFPYSFVGVQMSIPIFTGLRRLDNVRKAKLQEERTDWDEVNVKLSIYSQYRQALAAYKSNFYNLHEQADNVGMAREVYDIVRLQYREGIKAYLDMIVAESQLETSEINYLNSLFQLLQSKVDLEKAMGDIPTNF